jgi:hypothetical protein
MSLLFTACKEVGHIALTRDNIIHSQVVSPVASGRVLELTAAVFSLL